MIAGALLLGVLGLTLLHTLFELPHAQLLAQLALVAFVLVAWRQLRRLAQCFAVLGGASLVLVGWRAEQPLAVIDAALAQGAWYCAFLVALGCLPVASNRSARLLAASARLVSVAGRNRYAALTLASHLFGLMLSLTALPLLIGAVLRHTGNDAGEAIARRRDAVLAILRGFAPTAAWSPLSIGPAVVVSVVPAASWQHVYLLGVGLAVVMLLLGALVHRIERTPAADSPPAAPPQSWRVLLPVLALVAGIFLLLLISTTTLGLSLPESVMLVIPLVTLAWLGGQRRGNAARPSVAALTRRWRGTPPRQATEIVVLAAAGVIGVALSALLPTAQLATALASLDLGPTLLLLGVFWALLGAGMLGISPLVTIILIGAILADPAQFGLPPLLLAGVFISSWCLIAQLSPYSASALLSAAAANMPSTTLILQWNRGFILAALLLVHASLLISGFLIR